MSLAGFILVVAWGVAAGSGDYGAAWLITLSAFFRMMEM